MKLNDSKVRVFLPNEALQGEEIPSFALWRGITFDEIRVSVPEGLKVSEVYNVAREDWVVSGSDLSVKRVEVDGYLGLVLASEQLNETSKEVTIRWEFFRKDGGFSESKQIHVFRPMIEAAVPDQIKLDESAKIVTNPLGIKNKGFGTVIIGVRALADSRATVEEPEVVRDFTESFNKDVKAGFSDMKTTFPTFNDLIDMISRMFTEPQDLSDKENVASIRRAADKVNKASMEDERFLHSIGEVLGTALLANLQKFNIFQQMAEYLHAVEGRKVLIMNPLSTVHVTPGKSTLHLRVEYRDLAYGYYAPLEVKTLIVSNNEKTFPLYKLFSWGN